MGSPQQDPIQPALGWDGLRWVGLIFGPHPMMIPTWPGGMRGAIEYGQPLAGLGCVRRSDEMADLQTPSDV